MSLQINHEFVLPDDCALQRLDQAVAAQLPQYSRARLQQWIKEGALLVGGKPARSKDKVYGNEQITIAIDQPSDTDQAEDIPLDVVFEDEHLLVINKPAGLVVHPGAGNPTGTMLNALLSYDNQLANVPRAGIVHRLDKDTSGLMVVARSLEVQHGLVKGLQARDITRIYDAIVYGTLARREGVVEGAIGRHPHHRKKMAIRPGGKAARTFYRLVEGYEEHALIECKLDTGRTHQIRVHMQSIGHPLVGDPVYGGHYRRPRSGDEWLAETLKRFNRQALHARKLELIHPVTRQSMSWKAAAPEDFQDLLDFLHRE